MKELVKQAFSYLDVLIKPPLEEIGGLLSDSVKLFRYKNQVRIINSVEDFHKKKGITPKQIPLKLAKEILEESSWEEDKDIQDMWVSLMANASDSNNSNHNESIFVKILKELTPLDVKILNSIYEGYQNNNKRSQYVFLSHLNPLILDYHTNNVNSKKIQDKAQFTADNFVRLGLLSTVNISTPPFQSKYYSLTQLGIEFLDTCTTIKSKGA